MARETVTEASRRRLDDTVVQLRALLPSDWQVWVLDRGPLGGVVAVADEDERQADVYVVAQDRVEPRDLERLRLPEPSLVSAAWLSPRTRELLRDAGASYVDRTGNAELRLRRPSVFVRTDGAMRDPDPVPSQAPGLRGPKAAALLRTLIDVAPPYSAGDLAWSLSLDDGYVSKVLRVLSDERLIERQPRAPVTDARWESLLRQLATTYRFFDANLTSTWVAAAGPAQLLADLPSKGVSGWAVTGSFAAASIAPVTSPEIAMIYTFDPERLAKVGRLLPAKVGANVILAEPYDDVVFRRGWSRAAFPCVSVAQMAVDLLSGSARMPAEGEAVIEWMRRNPAQWRRTDLRD